MIKIRILDRCEFCDCEAYIFVSEDVHARGEIFPIYNHLITEVSDETQN